MSEVDKFEMPTLDGPVAEVALYGEQVTIFFDWSGPNQRHYLTAEEARQIYLALGRAINKQAGGSMKIAGVQP